MRRAVTFASVIAPTACQTQVTALPLRFPDIGQPQVIRPSAHAIPFYSRS
jgi:hypothetical protein